MISEEERNRLAYLAERDRREAQQTEAQKAQALRQWKHDNEQARLAKEAHERGER